MQLIPYLNFEGNCEEALNTYKRIFNGQVENINRYDNPAMKAPAEYRDKILHAVFKFNGISFFASDVYPGGKASGNNVALSLSFEDPEEAKRIFSALAEAGNVRVPFAKQFWGAWHGNLVDKFGILWMVNFEG